MNLQELFFIYIQDDVNKFHSGWSKRKTKQWFNCYANINGKERVIMWVKQPNRDGSFWIFISIMSVKIFDLHDLIINQRGNDSRKFEIQEKNIQMKPVEFLDRGLTAKNAWGKKWPVGIKVVNPNQFDLIKKMIILQWL
ncbi:MAG: hypothetical protein K8S13_05190 [Desulfobacula sp.]|uniref:hypothetical protein n=1 Tax=Desulfobacula sp. TaxID=2593537 RepID=UPI0025C5B963|nr:hypothetical protein [Desulfobacula sp.]MCD4719242.1 hypothetical protein [Desulfobacula sp.]